MLVFTLTDTLLFQLCDQVMPTMPSPAGLLFAAMHADDRRGGSIEAQNAIAPRNGGRIESTFQSRADPPLSWCVCFAFVQFLNWQQLDASIIM